MYSTLSYELKLFFIALTFLTRLPAPRWISFSTDLLSDSVRYYPMIGIVVGGIAALTYVSMSQLFSVELSVLFSMVVSILVTGAFHEDGFADSCDGFGGGWDKSQVLAIMKDSSVGTFGVVGLILLLAIKFFSLTSHPATSVVFSLVFAHGISRFMCIGIMYRYQYVQENTLSKVRPATTMLSRSSLLFSIMPIVPVVFFFTMNQVIFIILVLAVFHMMAGWYFVRRIGGYTGDCLGAIQQLSEALVYLVLLAVTES